MSAVSDGVKNIAITNAATKMPNEIEKPSAVEQGVAAEHQRGEGAGQDEPGGGDRRAGVLERLGRGVAWLSQPSRASSRRRAIIKML